MSSRHALAIFSFASRSAFSSRLFSRCRYSASTSIPKRSSKARRLTSGLLRCSVHIDAIASRRMDLSFSVVGSVSISLPRSVVVVRAADVLVVERRRLVSALHGQLQRLLVEPVPQDRFDVEVAARAGDERTLARSLESVRRVALDERAQATARAQAVLGMASLVEDRPHERVRARTDLLRPRQEVCSGLVVMFAMRRHVLRQRRHAAAHEAARVRGDALAVVGREDFDGRGADADLDVVADVRVRHRVVVSVAFDADVVVGPDRREGPVAWIEAVRRQPHDHGLVELVEEIAPAPLVPAHRAVVEIVEQLRDVLVQLAEREARDVAKAREDPALSDEHACLDLRLVSRARRSRRQNRRRVVVRPLLVRALDGRLVAARYNAGALELVREMDVMYYADKDDKK